MPTERRCCDECGVERDDSLPKREARTRVERMVQRYAQRGPHALNPDQVTVEHVLTGLARNLVRHGRPYCPCREVTGDPRRDRVNICPCPQHHEDIARDGICECGIFVGAGHARKRSAEADTTEEKET